MAGRVVYFSGDFVPEREANVSIFDCALKYGDMAFEMTRTFDGEPFKLREHLDRLYGSLRLLEIDCGLSQEELEEHAKALPAIEVSATQSHRCEEQRFKNNFGVIWVS